MLKHSNPLIPYSGKLSPSEIADGINAAHRNAARLASDARYLLEAGSLATATSLAILAIEEAGKSGILRQLAVANNDSELKDAWRDYRSHTAKNPAWILPVLAAAGARSLEELRPATARRSQHAVELDAVKQIGFYTDCCGRRHWSEPEKVIDAELAEQLVATAEILSKSSDVTAREIELWAEIVGPAWNTSKMKDAILRWNEAMIGEGLTNKDRDGFTRFVMGEEMGP